MADNGSSRGLRRLMAVVVVAAVALAVLIAHPASAFAGSITITQHDPDGNAIPGGAAAVYQVGVISGDSYQYVAPFDRLGDDLTSHITQQVDLRYLARLEAIARTYGTPVATSEIGADGKAHFYNLEWGAYLVVQVEPAPGYNSFDRFLVTIPWEGREDVDASPKLDPVHPNGNTNTNENGNNTNGNTPGNNTNNGNTPSNNTNNGNGNTPGNNTNGNTNGNTNTPGNGNTNGGSGGNGNTSTTSGGGSSSSGGSSSGGSTGSNGNLPQTGQLWWPVWVLLICGTTLVVGGLVWRDRHQDSGEGRD